MKLRLINPLVTICIPFSRNVLPDWAISLASIAPPMNATFTIRRTIGQIRDEAREQMAEKAVEEKSEFILCLDDDVTVPPNIVRQLLFAFGEAPDDVMVIGGIYCTKTSPAIPLVFRKEGEGPFYKWKLGEVFPCEIIATGMMMIRTKVFEGMPKPWFKDVDGVEEGKKYGLIPDDFDVLNFGINDDGFFCKRVADQGCKVMAHGGVLGMHWDQKGTAYVLPDNSYPMKTEIERRWGRFDPSNGLEHYKRYMSLVKEFYGYTDLLPLEQDVVESNS